VPRARRSSGGPPLRPRRLLCEAPKLVKKREEEREVIRFGWRVPCWAHLSERACTLGGPSNVLSTQILSLPFLLARGYPHARCPCSCPRVRAFNAQTPQDARRDFGTPGNRVPALFHQLPGGGHPRRCVALCGEAGVSSVTLCRLPPYS
jgi:hypothetical protein